MPCLLFCTKKDYTVTVHRTPQNCLVEEKENDSAHCCFTVSPGRLRDGGGEPFVTKTFEEVIGIFCQFSVWKVFVLHIITQYELRFFLSLCWWSGLKAVYSLVHLFMQKVIKNVWNLRFVVLGVFKCNIVILLSQNMFTRSGVYETFNLIYKGENCMSSFSLNCHCLSSCLLPNELAVVDGNFTAIF